MKTYDSDSKSRTPVTVDANTAMREKPDVRLPVEGARRRWQAQTK